MGALIRLALLGIGALGVASTIEGGVAPGPGFFGIGGGRQRRRRRRRRALNAGDREDLLFLGSLMSRAGVERVAAVMISRS